MNQWQATKKQKTRHTPSGIIIAWIGNDDKVHTKSIPNKLTSIGANQIKIDAKTELLLRQLDYLGGEIKSMPIITTGLTRSQAKEIVKNETESQLSQHISNGKLIEIT